MHIYQPKIDEKTNKIYEYKKESKADSLASEYRSDTKIKNVVYYKNKAPEFLISIIVLITNF